jgi:hypothetical protein
VTPTRSHKFLLRTLLVANLLAASGLGIGCSPDGAGTIHIDSPKARKQIMQIGARVAPAATAKPGAPGKSQK